MGTYSTQQIRNIVLIGQSGGGKTTLIEKLMVESGMSPSAGTVERGNTLCDFDPQEKLCGHSINPAICHLNYQGYRINILDTPGAADFSGRGTSVLSAADAAFLVIDADAGVEAIAEKMMAAAKDRKLCRGIIVNKIDLPGVNFPSLMQQITECFGAECLPINVPTKAGAEVVDCFFHPQPQQSELGDTTTAHDALVDQVVEVDEALMELYLEQGQALDPQQLHAPFEQALREGHLIPVCFTSAVTDCGLSELLDIITNLTPNPFEGNVPEFFKGEGTTRQSVKVTPSAEGHAIAHVFNVIIDPYIGKIGVFRIYQGTVTTQSQLLVGDARKPFKVSHLYRIQGDKHIEISRGIPGDICAVAKVEDIHFDAVLHDSHDEDHFHLRSVSFPPPMFGLAVAPEHRGDEQKLSDALHKLADEDPTLVIEHRVSLNETVMLGQSDRHLASLIQRMHDQFNVSVNSHPPAIAFRETISKPAEGHHRHKKQTGGSGQFGEVYLRIEPQENGAGFEFINKVVGGAIPGQFIPAIKKGVLQVMANGAIAGHRMQDIRVTVYDGKHHAVDSKEIAFVAAGRKAFIEAIHAASPVLLEPVVNLTIEVPEHCIGDITGDLSAKHGMILGTRTLPGHKAEISAQAPVRELVDYLARIKSLSGGEGSFGMTFSHYEKVPAALQKSLINEHSAEAD